MIEGGCNCGAIRYRIDAAPLGVAACHCTRCRRQSGSAYSVNLVAPSAMSIEGELAVFEDTETSSGARVYREFCGRCGSPIRSVLSANPSMVAVKAGTLDDPEPFAPRLHVFTRSKIRWVEIPAEAAQFETTPV
jgi:hypothetical protein